MLFYLFISYIILLIREIAKSMEQFIKYNRVQYLYYSSYKYYFILSVSEDSFITHDFTNYTSLLQIKSNINLIFKMCEFECLFIF